MHKSSSSAAHNPFFASLKHLEKRLKLETHTPPQPPPPPPPPPIERQKGENTTSNTQQTDSLGTPIYLIHNTLASTQQESETPREFLSNPPDFPPTHNTPLQETRPEVEEPVDEEESWSLDCGIELLMQLLGLSDCEGTSNVARRLPAECDDDGFYGRIVGLKGPKSGREVERLDGWIRHFMNGEVKEPFRLAHLLLGKASLVRGGGDDSDGFEGFEFPSTVAEFLQSDPPID